jgi:hypothetical protein
VEPLGEAGNVVRGGWGLGGGSEGDGGVGSGEGGKVMGVDNIQNVTLKNARLQAGIQAGQVPLSSSPSHPQQTQTQTQTQIQTQTQDEERLDEGRRQVLTPGDVYLSTWGTVG